jgi:hypothetical protein
MGLKRQVLDMIKKGVPTFDEENDYFVIDFEGGGDSFDSFHSFDTDASGWDADTSSDFIDTALLLDVIDASGVEYVFVGGSTSGKIYYSNGVLEVETDYQDDYDIDDDDPDEGWFQDRKELTDDVDTETE